MAILESEEEYIFQDPANLPPEEQVKVKDIEDRMEDEARKTKPPEGLKERIMQALKGEHKKEEQEKLVTEIAKRQKNPLDPKISKN